MTQLISRIFLVLSVVAGTVVGQEMAATRPATSATPETSASQAVRFAWVDVFIDSGAIPMAVYQFELKVAAGDAKIVGVEKGDTTGFQDPPYYDPAALNGGRIVVGAFSTSAELAKGRSRVARLHLMITGDIRPQYTAKLIVAGSKDGTPVQANISFVEGASR